MTPSGLLTDLYELRMVESYLRHGLTGPATFSLYIRPTPERPWFVALGVGRAVEFVSSFAYGPDELAYIQRLGFRQQTIDWLAALRPSGEIWAVVDGTIVLAEEPILEITAPLPFAQLVETAIINLVQYPTLVATKAARVAMAAAGRPVFDFGFRRAHGLDTGVQAAAAAYVGGGLTTSNMEAGRRFGLHVVGTMAHSFVQAHRSELEAFRTFAADHPDNAVLLVDTYDTLDGVRSAIAVADEMPVQGIRLDSGDLDAHSRAARAMLDDAGHREIRIFASGALDEHRIAALTRSGAPIDAFGVGTDLVVSADRPAVDIAYKLVAYDARPVAKRSAGKRSLPGAKQVFRAGSPERDVLGLRDEDLPGGRLLRAVWRDGRSMVEADLEGARRGAREGIATLPRAWTNLEPFGEPPRPRRSEALRELANEVDAAR